ncbi:MAG: HTTM domain-containing protein [Kofleriaceae bacterium]
MRRLWNAWVALWDRRESPAALAAVRIALGVVLLYDLLSIAWLGLITPLFALPPDGFAMPHTGWAADWLGTGPHAAFALWLAATIAAGCLVVGAATRVACVVFVLVSAQLAYTAPSGDRGIDVMLRVFVAILAFSRCNAVWSVDRWVWRWLGRRMPDEVPAWPRYLLMLQLVWIYFSGGSNKSGAEWRPDGGFAALSNALTDPHLARFSSGWVELIDPVARMATALTMLFELAAPVYLLLVYFAETADRPGRARRFCNRYRLRFVWLGLGAAFHLGIAATLQLGIFPWGMLAIYPALLLPREVAALTRVGRAG